MSARRSNELTTRAGKPCKSKGEAMDEGIGMYLCNLHKQLDDDDVSDAMFMQRMQEGVEEFNRLHKTQYDPYDTVMEYISDEELSGFTLQ